MTALRLPRRGFAATPSPRSSRTRALRRLHWLRHAAAAGTLTLAMLHGTPDAQAQVASTPAGDEFQVNTFTTDNQRAPSVAMDADGDFVVTWRSLLQDGEGNGIYAQRFNAAGEPQGDEFQVNTFTTDNQRFPSVAMDADGDFVIAWAGKAQDTPYNNYGVFAQRYAADGTAQGDEFQVNTYITSSQSNPSVAMDADGDFVIVWDSSDDQDGEDEGIFAQRYNADGVAQGEEFQVNTFTTEEQQNPAVAMDADGNFVIVWVSDGFRSEQDGDRGGVFAQRYNAEGVAQGDEFQVNTTTKSDQHEPAVAMDANGDFVIVWESSSSLGTADGDGEGVYARRYNAEGVAQGDEFQVNTYTTDNQDEPEVAMDAAGNFVVTWISSDFSIAQDGDRDGVFAQRFLADGTPDGDEFQVNTFTTRNQEQQVVAVDADGDFVIVWAGDAQDDPTDAFGSGVFAQRYAASESPAVFDLALTTEVVYTGPGSGTVTATMTNTGDVAADLVRVKRTQQRDVTVAEKQIVVGPLAPGEAGSVVFTFTDAEEGATIKLRGQDLTVQGGEDDFENNLATITLDPPDLIVGVTPDGEPPFTVPSEGGSLWFTGIASNTTDAPLEQQTWVVLDGPGDDDSMVFGPQTIRLAPGQTVDRRFEVILGPDDPVGTYTVIARLGTFPDGVDSEESFTFEKLGGDGLRAGGGSANGTAEMYAPNVGGPVWGVTDDAEWAAILAADAERKAALAAQAEEEAAALAAMIEAETLPEVFALVEPYPNPMSGLSSVRFELPEEADVTVTLYDVLGRTVAVLAAGTFEAGRHEAVLDGRTLASGAYVVRFKAGEHTLAKPVTVIR